MKTMKAKEFYKLRDMGEEGSPLKREKFKRRSIFILFRRNHSKSKKKIEYESGKVGKSCWKKKTIYFEN